MVQKASGGEGQLGAASRRPYHKGADKYNRKRPQAEKIWLTLVDLFPARTDGVYSNDCGAYPKPGKMVSIGT